MKSVPGPVQCQASFRSRPSHLSCAYFFCKSPKTFDATLARAMSPGRARGVLTCHLRRFRLRSPQLMSPWNAVRAHSFCVKTLMPSTTSSFAPTSRILLRFSLEVSKACAYNATIGLHTDNLLKCFSSKMVTVQQNRLRF